jgi:hypothetical protein
VDPYLHSPNTPSWSGAQLKKSTGSSLSLPFTGWRSGYKLGLYSGALGSFSAKKEAILIAISVVFLSLSRQVLG